MEFIIIASIVIAVFIAGVAAIGRFFSRGFHTNHFATTYTHPCVDDHATIFHRPWYGHSHHYGHDHQVFHHHANHHHHTGHHHVTASASYS